MGRCELFCNKTCYMQTSYINISRAIIYKTANAIHLTQSYNKLYYDKKIMRLGEIHRILVEQITNRPRLVIFSQ